MYKTDIWPVWFKVGVPFSPLHADGDHAIQNKETCTWHGVKGEKCTDWKNQIHFLRNVSFKEISTHTFAFFHIVFLLRLRTLNFSVNGFFISEEWKPKYALFSNFKICQNFRWIAKDLWKKLYVYYFSNLLLSLKVLCLHHVER